jgi:acetyl esterase/lipase
MKTILFRLFLVMFTLPAPALADPPSAPAGSRQIDYGHHDGARLTGDLYSPATPGRHPVLVAVHGGDWAFADSSLYRHWGPWLAAHGYALFAINYRLVSGEHNRYPAAIADVLAAVQFLRGNATSLGIDPERIGLMGDSAGAHLASLTALAADEPAFANAYRDDPYAGVSARVKACVAIYGVYDLAAQWNYDEAHDPKDNIAQAFLGAALPDNRRLYFEASPLSYATREHNRLPFLLVWGTKDDRVDPRTQSDAFAQALRQADFSIQTVVIKGAPHYWASDPIEAGKYPAQLAPRLLEFLQKKL